MITFYCTIYFAVALLFLNLKPKESKYRIRYLKCSKCVFVAVSTSEPYTLQATPPCIQQILELCSFQHNWSLNYHMFNPRSYFFCLTRHVNRIGSSLNLDPVFQAPYRHPGKKDLKWTRSFENYPQAFSLDP